MKFEQKLKKHRYTYVKYQPFGEYMNTSEMIPTKTPRARLNQEATLRNVELKSLIPAASFSLTSLRYIAAGSNSAKKLPAVAPMMPKTILIPGTSTPMKMMSINIKVM